jgi:hypothetical protein
MRLDADRRNDSRRQLTATRHAMMAKRGFRDRLQAWRRSLSDPLRNAPAATRWIGGLPAGDALQLQREALDLVASFPGTRRNIGPNQAEALLRIDARIAPLIVKLTAQYAANYQRSTGVETRLWHGVFDLVKAFIAAYQATLKVGMVGDPRRWKAVLPGILVRLAHYRCIDGKFRLFRYGHWIPAQWRDLRSFHELARMRAAGNASLLPCRTGERMPRRSPSSANTSRVSCSCASTAAASPPTRSNGWRARSKSGSTR